MSVSGIINLNKPTGISSAFAVSKVKRILKTRSVGHMGTLDPAAEGVLLIGVGKATRLFNYLLNKDKAYEACFTFGYETDTLDREGAVVKTVDKIPQTEEILNALLKFLGKQMQVPPLYSAKNVDGQRSYELARQGKAVELKPSQVEIYNIELLRAEPPAFWFSICCSSGTYIRSICRDLAESVGCCATMTSLKRTRCGKYGIEKSVDFDSLLKLGDGAVVGLDIALSETERLDVPLVFQKKLDNGVKFKLDGIVAGTNYVVYCNGILYGIGVVDVDSFIKITTYLKD